MRADAVATRTRRRRLGAAGLALLAAGVAAAMPATATAQVEPYGTDNYGTFYNILPPGTNGLDNAVQLTQFLVLGQRPPHNNDQLSMYSNLTTAAPNIQAAQITNFFKDATFGVKTGELAGSESPEPGVTIERDSQFGVPHIYGDTRAELMFGIGYATAEDRLFFIDALRHAGQGDLASFAGGSNVPMDESVWQSSPYTQQDLVNQVNEGIANLPDGQQILSDATNYVAGINAYISQAQLDPLLMPAEYTALGDLGGPQPFTVEDLVSIASLVGGIFGRGGGAQLTNAILYENLKQRFGPEHYAVPGIARARQGQGGQGKEQGKGGQGGQALGPPSRPLGLCHLHELRRPQGPRSAHDGSGEVVPVSVAAVAQQDGARERGASRPWFRAVRQPGRCRRRSRQRAAGRRAVTNLE